MFLIIYGEWFLLTLKFQWRDNVGFSRRFFPRRLEYAFSATICHLLRHLQDVLARRLQGVTQASSRRVYKKSSRRRLANTSWRCLTKNVKLKASSRCYQHVFTKMNVCWVGTHFQAKFQNLTLSWHTILRADSHKLLVLLFRPLLWHIHTNGQ